MRTIGLSSLLCIVCGVTHADLISLGPDGINSIGLGLTGLGVHIGQVEVFRPGKPNYDSANLVNPHVNTASVWWTDAPATQDFLIDDVINTLQSSRA